MAKVKGPLMSMDARGQLGKSLVFLGWKGLKTVRSHVVPANPQTDAQQLQRGHMTDAVSLWHSMVYNVLDFDAWRVLAGIQVKAMSGFNVFCKRVIALIIGEIETLVPYGAVVGANTGGGFTLSLTLAGSTACKFRCGLSPSVMGIIGVMAHVNPGDPYVATIGGYSAGDYVYFQMFTEVADTEILTGIYKVLCLP